MIYLLMLAGGGDTTLTHNINLPTTLLFTLRAHYDWMNQNYPASRTAVDKTVIDAVAWDDWVFNESKCRTAMLYFMFGLFFDIEFGLPCDRELDYHPVDVNLPAPKPLWEARDDLSWRAEYDIACHPRDPDLKYGDLLQLNQQDVGAEDENAEEIQRLVRRVEKWHEEMDDFGMLVTFCSTIIGQ
ncbi:hypothetical protein G647_03953 [Cladophialophora carrionii CBS 160.54]|uniref:Transcription factor domain-containing protein n=1 Tax=Cladophialophora carrionii CBS 160.54 TaxID=1279043 RepID=V9DCF4_9EURO|nr:uncharacterized protein G647_03953 [Cladophialophora carrionii CBS 160.54]ETI24584.1 hypothetical protein G647_03953 [Cladophialophora carrionii CBS 160.54]